MNPANVQAHILSDTDAQLVSAVALHDPLLAHRVQLRLKALRLRLVAGQAPTPQPARQAWHVWHSLRWPWRPRS